MKQNNDVAEKTYVSKAEKSESFNKTIDTEYVTQVFLTIELGHFFFQGFDEGRAWTVP